MRVSIIVPIYNVSKYLDNSLNTILQQDYHNYEVVMINDGSTDNSLKIAQNYEERDKRFKVYSTKNQGLSSARNEGLKHISGDIIYFMDADDQLAPNALSILVSFFEDHSDVDVIHFSSTLTPHPLKNINSSKIIDSCVVDNKNALRKLMEVKLQPTAWSNISRGSLIMKNRLQFSPGRLFEDENFNTKLFARSNKVGILKFNSGPYYYLVEKRKGKLMNEIMYHKNLKQLKDRLFIVSDEYKYLDNLKLYDNSYLLVWYLNKLIWIYNYYYNDVSRSDKNLFNKLRNDITKLYEMSNTRFTVRQRLQYWKVKNVLFYHIMTFLKKIADVFRSNYKKL